MSNTAILLAGGKGSRMRGTVKDKVLAPLMGLPVIMHSFKSFMESGAVENIVFVCRDDVQIANIKNFIKTHFKGIAEKTGIAYAYGGAERQDSVLNGLEKISDKSGTVFIHDGARPLVGAQNITRLAQAAEADGASVLAARVTDTIKRVPANKSDLRACRLEDMDRGKLWAMQTPQVFRASEILAAYENVKKKGLKITDDVAAAVAFGIGVTIVENLMPNPKITLPEDIAFIEFLGRKNGMGKSAKKTPAAIKKAKKTKASAKQ